MYDISNLLFFFWYWSYHMGYSMETLGGRVGVICCRRVLSSEMALFLWTF